MLNWLNGTLWQTLETPSRGVEIARNGWGHPSMLAALPQGDVPGIWLTNDVTGGLPPMVQRFISTKGPVEVILQNGQPVGAKYEDAYAEYVLLMGVAPDDLTASREVQARSVFDNIDKLLKDAGYSFHDVVRTWLYLDKLLEWYDVLNRVRDEFFETHGIFGGFVPASTGIGCANSLGAEMIAGAIAMRPKDERATKAMLESPLQCSALDYRSSFSRAAEIVTPEWRTVFVSGTASIEPGGLTVHHDDMDKQVALTMDVVKAILETRGMTFKDSVRAIAYIKRPEDRPAWQNWLKENGLPADYAQEIIADVCRDDLLFELELDAVQRL
jgi:enamine deaminase RidA (YjgF/YER057c/UK114 family)